jgi:hypothetical protein
MPWSHQSFHSILAWNCMLKNRCWPIIFHTTTAGDANGWCQNWPVWSGLGICGTQVKSSVRMKKTQESSKWLFLGNLIPEIESKAPN